MRKNRDVIGGWLVVAAFVGAIPIAGMIAAITRSEGWAMLAYFIAFWGVAIIGGWLQGFRN